MQKNLVSCGIVGRSHSRLDYYLCDVKAREEKLYEQETTVNELNLQFHINGVNLKEKLEPYYFRPYISSLGMVESLNTGKNTIRYGETVAYNCFPGEIGEIKQIDSSCSYSDNGSEKEVTFRIYASACFDLEDHKNVYECGVYYQNENGLLSFNICTPTRPLEGISMPGHQEAYIDISVLKSKFDYVDEHNFKASKTVKIGLYCSQEVGGYRETVFGEPLEYELIYDTKPEINITGGGNIGTEILSTEIYADKKYTKYKSDFIITCDIKGAFWIQNLDLIFSVTHCHDHFYKVDKKWSDNWKPLTTVYDGNMELNFHWIYDDFGWYCQDHDVFDRSYTAFIMEAHTGPSEENDQVFVSKNYISFYGESVQDNISVGPYD